MDQHLKPWLLAEQLMLLTASEKGGTALLYDITVAERPQVLKVFHLSPASESKSAGLAVETMGQVILSLC